MNRKLLIICISALIAALIAADVIALGITPARRSFDFQPDSKFQVTFKVLNSEKKDMNILISARGELASYITLHGALVPMKSTDESKTFTYDVALPAILDKPGVHKAEVVVLELPKDVTSEGASVGATPSVVHELLVRVPYTGKYAELKLDVSEAKADEATAFVASVMNFGEEDITAAKVVIDIFSPTNERLTTIESDELPVKAKQTSEFVVKLNERLNLGTYRAVATLRYDGKMSTDERSFSVGGLLVDVNDLTVKEFRLGGVAKFTIGVESRWNEPIGNVYADMLITNVRGDSVAVLKTPTSEVPPFARSSLYAYWDTEGVSEGTYNAKVTLHYGDRSTEKQFKAQVSVGSIDTSLVGGTGRVVASTNNNSRRDSILLIAVVLLVLVNIGWFIYMRRKK